MNDDSGRFNDKPNKQYLRPGAETSPKFSEDFEYYDNLNMTSRLKNASNTQ